MSLALSPSAIVVRRYGIRLYDTAALCNVSLGQLRRWREAGVVVCVIDSGTGADITANLLD